MWDNFWRANYRTSLPAVLILGVLEVRRIAFLWHGLLGSIGDSTKSDKTSYGEGELKTMVLP